MLKCSNQSPELVRSVRLERSRETFPKRKKLQPEARMYTDVNYRPARFENDPMNWESDAQLFLLMGPLSSGRCFDGRTFRVPTVL